MEIIFLIFLDFDGVLNSRAFLMANDYGERSNELDSMLDDFRVARNVQIDAIDVKQIDPSKVALLNQIVKETGAKIVVSSSWRIGKSIEHLQAILDFHGFVGEVIGKTCSFNNADKVRGDEIYDWLFDYFHAPPTSEFVREQFVIIDDDSDMGDFEDRLVHTSFAKGLQPEHVAQAISMLNE